MGQFFLRGLRLGMLLQLSVGPVCLFVLNTANEGGLWVGLASVTAVALVDGLYLTLAGAGVGALLTRPRRQRALRWLGCGVLALFGADTLLSAAGHPLLGGLALPAVAGGPFLQALAFTASNPLTILFWGGVFVAEAPSGGRQALVPFALGCVAATVLFLSAVAGAGALLGRFLPAALLTALNVLVGVALLGFAGRLAWQAWRGRASKAEERPDAPA